ARDLTGPSVGFQDAQGGFEVGDFADSASLQGPAHEVAGGEPGGSGASGPVQDDAGVVDGRVGADGVVGSLGVGGEVLAELACGLDGGQVDGAAVAVAEVGGEVEQGGDADDGANEFPGPVGHVGQVAGAGPQPRLDVLQELDDAVLGLLGEGEGGRRAIVAVGP